MKYKLVKTYPLCPFELGAVATDENVKSDVMLCIRTDVGRYTTYPKEAIVNNPEFWEEVKEKEYTILSFDGGNGEIFNRNHIGDYIYIGHHEAKGASLALALEAFKIHSVRREKDGIVFQLGDNIDTGNVVMGGISEFIINRENQLIVHVHGFTKDFYLDKIQKAPIRKPILITEDKVEIFENDKYWWTDHDFKVISQIAGEGKQLVPNGKRFSTKEKCEEYIKWNKPMYSLNDIKEVNRRSYTENRDLIQLMEQLDRK